jgi:hypothetical protein
MPTVKCPTCATTVRFEGVAGLCPKCGKILRVSTKSVGAAAPATSTSGQAAPKGRAKGPDLDNLGIDPEQAFAPAETQTYKAKQDPIIFYLSAGAGGIIVLFALYFVLEALLTRSTPAPSPAPVAAPVVAVAPPPTPTDNVLPPPPSLPETPVTPSLVTTRPASGPAWMALRPVVPSLKATSITDKMVEATIKKGVAYLKTQFANGQLVEPSESDFYYGEDAICVYSLLQAGLAVDDSELGVSNPFMQGLLDHLKRFPMEKDKATYERSLRASAYAIFERDVDRPQLEKDRKWLLDSELGGKYSYSMPNPGTTAENANWDNSNCQYGVLGIWAASQAGLAIPDKYWTDVEQHWLTTQDPDGGWAYNSVGGDSKLSMTCAGVTTLCVTAEQLELIASKGKKDARPKMSKAIDVGIAFIGDKNRLPNLFLEDNSGYTLYGVERAALATGYRWFGPHDWYRELGATEISRQNKTGSWNGTSGEEVETAFGLLFLSRGRQPVLMNKLRFDGDWNDRPRDAAKLAQFASVQLEKPFAWGVADLSRDWWDWLESPLLMISTDSAPDFTDEECGKLRSYTDAGGLIFFHNEFGSKEVDTYFKQLARRVYPEFPITTLAPNDVVYTCDFPIKKKLDLQAVGNGTRTFMIYSPKDVTQDWVRFRPKDKADNVNLQLGINLFVTASGKSNFRNRLSSPYEPVPDFAPIGTMPVLQITYSGAKPHAWDPEPKAYEQFSRWFQNQTSIKLDVQPTMLTAIAPAQAPIAVLTGNQAVDFSKMDLHALSEFVRKGGVLMIDSTGGNKAFAASVKDSLLPNAFPGMTTESAAASNPILAGGLPCMDNLPKAHLRSYASMLLDGVAPNVQFGVYGQGAVIISDLDITTGLLNSGTYGIYGYTPAYCQSLMKNVMIWALSRYVH